jgi:hypothetical protein
MVFDFHTAHLIQNDFSSLNRNHSDFLIHMKDKIRVSKKIH